ncbi:hypothetical protein CH330_03710 [candidate division WOR-3 bacterium JGI_Cruoil_03_51_56]|uniref:Uncharacterized protein n=1 Tax=candidate division WOR-3 bacterium JGI_Cruoil_03_51_56 TaxID=1973747 RepID=A0A235BUI6_UNCW3|nr:MAG: hypothetical protein CH330_03710 [candidate division WOR-3 bacterium JGI_Cruoil_03_51_56]
MPYLWRKIVGIPYSRNKTRGDIEAPKLWTEAIIAQTCHLPKIKEACMLGVTFLLPPNKFPVNLPYGPDLDNLLKRFCDALGKTIFSETRGGDSCVVSVSAMKTRVKSKAEAGAIIEVLPVSLTDQEVGG